MGQDAVENTRGATVHVGVARGFWTLSREGASVGNVAEAVVGGDAAATPVSKFGEVARGHVGCGVGGPGGAGVVSQAEWSGSDGTSEASRRSHCHGSKQQSTACGATPKVSPCMVLGCPERGDIQVRGVRKWVHEETSPGQRTQQSLIMDTPRKTGRHPRANLVRLRRMPENEGTFLVGPGGLHDFARCVPIIIQAQ